MKLIDKDALVAEIERRIQFFTKESRNSNSDIVIALFGLKSFIDTLEVKDVDLENDVDKILEENDWNYDEINFYDFAKHFFELGLKELAKEDSVPQHSYYETIYHVGKEPRWKVGDILAYYMFFNDYEGEYEFGKVVNVEFNKETEDWLYTFEDGDECAEEELIREETYRKGR